MKGSQHSKQKKQKNNSKKELANVFKKFKLSYLVLPLIILSLGLFVTTIYVFFLIQNNKINNFTSPNIIDSEIPFVENITFPNTSSSGIAVFESRARVIVFGKNANLRFSPASSAKIMTALIALENYPLERVVKSTNISAITGSKMGLFEEEEITIENLLYGLMLPSGNDAAFVLAQNYSGGKDAFVEQMNKKALELKLTNTRFLDPAGFEDENFTTASDLARLASEAFKNEKFQKIVRTKSLTVFDISGKISHNLENLNKLLDIPGVVGVKTGFTDEAGGVLVTAIEKEGRTYFIVVLRSQDRFYDTRNIISSIVNNIKLKKF